MTYKITDNIFKYAIAKLVKDISDYSINNKIEKIIAVSRGGLVPGVYLSHKLNLPLQVIEYSARDNMCGDNSYAWLANELNAVIVDDIADSGLTLNFLKSINPSLPTAVLVQKELSDHEAMFYGIRVSGIEWIEFDWEDVDN